MAHYAFAKELLPPPYQHEEDTEYLQPIVQTVQPHRTSSDDVEATGRSTGAPTLPPYPYDDTQYLQLTPEMEQPASEKAQAATANPTEYLQPIPVRPAFPVPRAQDAQLEKQTVTKLKAKVSPQHTNAMVQNQRPMKQMVVERERIAQSTQNKNVAVQKQQPIKQMMAQQQQPGQHPQNRNAVVQNHQPIKQTMEQQHPAVAPLPQTPNAVIHNQQQPMKQMVVEQQQPTVAPPPHHSNVVIQNPAPQVVIQQQPAFTMQVQQPIVVTQPPQQHVVFQNPSRLVVGRKPAQTVCSNCHREITTKTVKNLKSNAWSTCVILCVFGCWLCFWIPFIQESNYRVTHQCPQCGNIVGTLN